MRTALALMLAYVGLAWSTCVLVPALAPRDPSAIAEAQVRHLAAVMESRADDMQALFPEGAFFTYALTGMAAANLAAQRPESERRALLDVVEQSLRAVDRPELAAPFGSNPALEHGVFYRGWRLWLIQGLTLPDGSGRHTAYAARAADEARQISAALTASPTGMVTSYPGRTWPCDNVVAMAAVAAVEGRQQPAWTQTAQRLTDPATGLLPHEVDTAGKPLDGPRGSSQTIIQTFWPRLTSNGTYDSYTAAFVTRQLGLVGVREHPLGNASPGDVDSGPLILGVSLSASAVGLAAARAHGDVRLADTLDREADLLGVPLDWHGSRSYALGQLPVGDAFLAWARSIPLPPTVHHSPTPAPLWGWAASGGAVLLAVGLWLGQLRPRRRA